jgi:rSAM/selenodomain-associated transferase 2
MKISVVIPTLNEAAYIGPTVEALLAQEPPLEVIVADGGSDDGTRERAGERCRVITSAPGRARQMNAGAGAATGDVLLFLHADTLVAPGTLGAIRSTLADPSAGAGTFRLRFDTDTPLLRFYSWFTHLETPLLCFGDRGLFVRRAVFQSIGGFDDIPAFEDLDLARRLFRRGGFRFLHRHVTTAARRFERYGHLRQQARNALLWTAYMIGFSPRHLAQYYSYSNE